MVGVAFRTHSTDGAINHRWHHGYVYIWGNAGALLVSVCDQVNCGYRREFSVSQDYLSLSGNLLFRRETCGKEEKSGPIDKLNAGFNER